MTALQTRRNLSRLADAYVCCADDDLLARIMRHEQAVAATPVPRPQRTLKREPKPQAAPPEPQSAPAIVAGKLFAKALRAASKFAHRGLKSHDWQGRRLDKPTPERPELHCVRVETEPGLVRLIATDTYRLYIVTLECEGGHEGAVSIPLPEVEALAKAAQEQAAFEVPTGDGGGFVNWRKHNPISEPVAAATCAASDLLQNVRLANIIARDDNGRVTFTLGDGEVALSAKTHDSAMQTAFDATVTGEARVALQAPYVAQFADLAKRQPVTLQVWGGLSPVRFVAGHQQYILMPMWAL